MLFQLLQIHPLTLEDILTQDPREKFELFPSLGYYFVAFRTIESKKTRERRRLRMFGNDAQRLEALDEGIVGIVNVYLVVFREGVCSVSFRFTSFNRILLMSTASSILRTYRVCCLCLMRPCTWGLIIFTDHIDTVRNRVQKLDDPATMSPGQYSFFHLLITSTQFGRRLDCTRYHGFYR